MVDGKRVTTDLDFEKERKRLVGLSPSTAGEFLRAARIAATSPEGFWAEVAWEVRGASLATPPRLAGKGSLAKELHAMIKGKGMAGVNEAADLLLQSWRDAGGTTTDIKEALFRARTI